MNILWLKGAKFLIDREVINKRQKTRVNPGFWKGLEAMAVIEQ